MSTARVDFTRGAAERIARVVRLVEQGERDQKGPTFPMVAESSGKVFRMATFTGSWSINTVKTVTLQGSTATLQAYNVFATIGVGCGFSPVAIARDGTAWYAIAARCQ